MIARGEAEAAATGDATARLIDRLVSARGAYVARSNAGEHALMVQHARVVEQARARFAAKGRQAQFAAAETY